MKQKNKRYISPLAVAAGMLAAAFNANAATLVQGEWQTIGHTNGAANSANPGISVTSGSEGYSTGIDGLGTGGLDGSFNAAIQDYAFYTSGTGSMVESFGGSASLIGATTAGGTSTDIAGYSIWAGSSTVGTADQTTYARGHTIAGSVDISVLSSGSLYMFFGVRVGTDDIFDISFTLSGTGQTDLVLAQGGINDESVGAGGQDNAWFVYRADFADAADYDTLNFTYTETGGTNGARGRFAGVVLTAVPEPSTALLGGLGLLALLRRRR